MLHSNVSLESLEFQSSFWDENAVWLFFELMTQNKQLHSLTNHCSGIVLSDALTTSFANVIRHNNTLTRLRFVVQSEKDEPIVLALEHNYRYGSEVLLFYYYYYY